MTAKRTLLSGLLGGALGLGAVPAAWGQSPGTLPAGPTPSAGGGLLPGQQPANPGMGGQNMGAPGPGGGTPGLMPGGVTLGLPNGGGSLTGAGPGMNMGGPANTLTAAPGLSSMGTGLPPGTVAGPWSGGQPAGSCCGPVGANGPITYELYARTGPTFIIGGGPELSGATRFGWQVGGGGRTLFYNTARDGAFTIDTGLSYSYNGTDQSRVFDVFARAPLTTNPQTGQQSLTTPDQLQPFSIRGLTRITFNYAFGYDWFLNGPGITPYEQGWNSRFGVDVGGRWGRIRADLLPIGNLDSYARRSGVSHSLTFGAHYNVEVPFGATILFAGVRAEYGFGFSNVIPPQDGNFQDITVLLSLGVRF